MFGVRRGPLVDASWTHARHRAAADELVLRTHSDLVRLQCRVPVDVAAARLVQRGPTASDATAAVARAMSADADPWGSPSPIGPLVDPKNGVVAGRPLELHAQGVRVHAEEPPCFSRAVDRPAARRR